MSTCITSSSIRAVLRSMAIVVACLGAVLSGGNDQLNAAEGDVIAVDLKSFQFKVRDEFNSLFGYDENESKLFYYTSGPGETMVKLPVDGKYEISIKASCDPALGERAKFKVTLDGQPVGMETLLTDSNEKEYTLTTTAKAGERKLVIEFTNDAYKENEYDRNLYIHAVTLKRSK